MRTTVALALLLVLAPATSGAIGKCRDLDKCPCDQEALDKARAEAKALVDKALADSKKYDDASDAAQAELDNGKGRRRLVALRSLRGPFSDAARRGARVSDARRISVKGRSTFVESMAATLEAWKRAVDADANLRAAVARLPKR